MSADLLADGKERVNPIDIANYTKSDSSLVGGANRAVSATSTNDWTHYVITRSWNEENATTHVGDFDDIKVYKNGVQVYSNSTSWDIYNHDITVSPTGFALWSLAIGGWQNSSASTASLSIISGAPEGSIPMHTLLLSQS